MKLNALIFSFCLTFPIFAHALTPEQEIQINQKMHILEITLQKHDVIANLNQRPQAYLENFAKRAGMSLSQFKEASKENQSPNTKKIKLIKIDYNLAQGIEGHTSKRDYIFYPAITHVIWEKEGYKFLNWNIALLDNQEWYIIPYTNDINIQIIKETYPDLASIQFPN